MTHILIIAVTIISINIQNKACQGGKNSWLDHQMFLMNFPGIEKEPNFPQVEDFRMFFGAIVQQNCILMKYPQRHIFRFELITTI